MGALFPKDKEGGIFNLWGQWGKSKCQWDNPWNSQFPFLSHSSNHFILPEIGWSSYCMGMGRVWAWISNLGKTHFWLLGQQNTQNACPFARTPTFFIYSHRESLGVVLPSRFCSFSSSCMPINPFLVLFSKWARNIFVLGVYGSNWVPIMP